MLINFAIIVAIMLTVFLIFIATRSGKFSYERSGVINAPPEKIFPYVSNFQLGGQWSPYEKIDPNMKKIFRGQDGAVGSVMEFDGNRDAGSGKLQMLKIVPHEAVDIRLVMTKPFYADNLVQYRLTPEGSGTRFTWIMSGDGGYMSKLVTFVIDCEKMVGDQFSAGIANLKALVESQK